MKKLLLIFVLALLSQAARGQLPGNYQLQTDWLINNSDFPARCEIDEDHGEIRLSNGLLRRTIRTRPAAATVAFDNLMTGETIIRAVQPEASVTIDGVSWSVGGLSGQPNLAYFTTEWLDQLTPAPTAMQLVSTDAGKTRARFPWKQTRHHAPNCQWPPPGVYLRMDYRVPASVATPSPGVTQNATAQSPDLAGLQVSVHYELYDGIPLICKWLTVDNGTDTEITLDRFTAEDLAVVEQDIPVETRDDVPVPHPDTLHVETDMAFSGFTHQNSNRHAVHWKTDPAFQTQINYLLQSPCHLLVEPTYGPAQTIAPGKSFESFRVFELVYDGSDHERRALALKRMYRTVAPWVTENPLMMHMRTGQPEAVREAIDQCAEVGFEMLILSFGSGFDAENDDPQYLQQWKEIADYAHDRGIQIGCYSLLSSRRVADEQMIVSPPGQSPAHGNCPALTSAWGQEYFRKLRNLFEQTGFDLLEHDGSYPGDVDVTPRPPLQKGIQDSRWAQWRIISDFYKWMRGRGAYLNVPDYYYLVGSNKCGMGYRETNWSLPRAQQLIHTRQNIYDGSWTKTPSMGWMFVPLTTYHGGGAAATIEPLEQHLDHYQAMMNSNLAMGVQACYRGPRLYDTDRTREMVQQRVAWFKRHRDILESDLVHGRRADGRDLDWMLHVNPQLPERGLLAVFNPTPQEINKSLRVPLYYTGIRGTALFQHQEGVTLAYQLDDNDSVLIQVTVPAQSFDWYVITSQQ